MGEIVDLDSRRRTRARSFRRAGDRYYLDLADPDAYALAERLERSRPDVRLRVACVQVVEGALGNRIPVTLQPAQRAASYAIACGRGNGFMLAALRLAHGGGYDLNAPEVLVEAAASSGLEWDGTLRAARDERWEAPIVSTSILLGRAGITRLPTLQTGGRFVSGGGPIGAYLAVGRPAPSPRAGVHR